MSMNDTAELAPHAADPVAEPAPEIADEVVDRADIKSGKAVVRYGATELALANLRARYEGATFDMATATGDASARAARLELKTLRTALEQRRKEFKAPLLDLGKKIDSEAVRITAEIRQLEDPIDSQIKADEDRREREREAKRQAEADRVAKHRASIDTVRAYITAASAPGMTAARITTGIAALNAMAFGVEFEEFEGEINRVKDEAVLALTDLHTQAVEREAEAARLKAQRIENARLAAELAEQKRQQDLRAAELQRQSEELAAQQAEGERLERVAREQREAQHQAAVAAAKVAEAAEASTQVLKADPATADATAVESTAVVRPCVGTLGDGQAADVAPVVEEEQAPPEAGGTEPTQVRDIAALVECLRQHSTPGSLGDQAADALLEQAAEIERLRAAVFGVVGHMNGRMPDCLMYNDKSAMAMAELVLVLGAERQH